ncbi:MAG: ArsR/SmtB family transcription factor [Thermodesulfovibrionales bacterium]
MEEVLNIFKALSEETRLRVLNILQNGELCVCDIVAALKTSQPKISFHLNVLKEAGLIKDRKQGRWIHYRIDETDMFRRFLVLSILEKLTDKISDGDKGRLEAFLKAKEGRLGRASCGRREVSKCSG